MSKKYIEDSDWVAELRLKPSRKTLQKLQLLVSKSIWNFQFSTEDKEDLVQAATIKVLENLALFQNKSKFSTWVVAIAINSALAKSRTSQWSGISIEDAEKISPSDYASLSDNPELSMQRKSIVDLIELLIETELTGKQRMALRAELTGMPLQEIARRMKVTRGAIYKLTFDARKKLNKCLLKKNLTVNDLLSAME